MSNKTLWKDTLVGQVASAYQKVIDECNNMSDTEDIKESFDEYTSLCDELAKQKRVQFTEWLCANYYPRCNDKGENCWVNQDWMANPFPIPDNEYFSSGKLYEKFLTES